MKAILSKWMTFRARRIISAAVLSIVLLSVASNSAVAADFKDNNTALTAHIIKLNTGVTLEYVTQGKEDGQPIILLHGGGDSWHSWLRVLPLIPPQYRVYAITLRGHGLSDHPHSGYARVDFAHDIIAFIDQLHIEKPVIAGHSLGTMVAQAIAVIAPDHVSKLVLAGSPARIPKTATVEEITKRQSKPTVDVDFARDFQFSTVYSPIPADFAEIVVADAAKLQDYVWHGIKVGLSGDHFEDQLSKIQAPTLVLWGEKDTLVTREETDLLLSKVKTATLKVYPNTGHGVHWERPEEFTKDLVEFIQ
jgi:non-heme chloroperoxidase